jgi:adenylate cyclase
MSREEETQTFQQIAEEINTQVNSDRCTIYEFDAVKREVFSRFALGLAPGMEIRLPVTRGAIGFVIRTGRPLRLRDAYNDPRFDPSTDEQTGYRTKTLLTMPVLDSHSNVLGAIQVVNKVNGAFTTEDEEIVSKFCGQLAKILQRAGGGGNH